MEMNVSSRCTTPAKDAWPRKETGPWIPISFEGSPSPTDGIKNAAKVNGYGTDINPTTYSSHTHGIMGLKITLKPNEKMIIGGAVISNGCGKAEFIVENNVPILRQKDIIAPDDANTPARRIYLAIQLMYVDGQNLDKYQEIYGVLIREFVQAAPSSRKLVDNIDDMIRQGNYYQALRSTQSLIEFEQEVLDRVSKCTESLPVG
jgi:flagellar protein FlbT